MTSLYTAFAGGSKGSMTMFVIYGLFDSAKPDVIRYVGKTCQRPNVRFMSHLSNSLRKRKTHKARWIHRTLTDGGRIDLRILATTETLNEANRLERLHIKTLREAGARLTNGTDGGEGCVGRVVSEAVIRHIANLNKGKHLTESTKGKLRNAHLGKKQTEETKSKLRALINRPEHRAKMQRQKGWKHSEDAKAKISAAHKGMTNSSETRAKLRAAARLRPDGWRQKIGATLTGRKASDETKAKLSALRRGRPRPTGFAAKVSAALKGRSFTEEHKRKLSVARKASPDAAAALRRLAEMWRNRRAADAAVKMDRLCEAN
jgi:hypothetical protein